MKKYGNVKDRLNSLVNAVHNKLEQDRIETLSKSKSNMRPKRKRRRLTIAHKNHYYYRTTECTLNDTQINGSRAPVSTATRKLELTRLGRVGLDVVNTNCTKFGLRLWITWEREDTPQLCNYSIRNYTMYVRSRVTFKRLRRLQQRKGFVHW